MGDDRARRDADDSLARARAIHRSCEAVRGVLARRRGAADRGLPGRPRAVRRRGAVPRAAGPRARAPSRGRGRAVRRRIRRAVPRSESVVCADLPRGRADRSCRRRARPRSAPVTATTRRSPAGSVGTARDRAPQGDDRRLRADRGDRAGRNGRRLPGAAQGAEAAGRAQDDPLRARWPPPRNASGSCREAELAANLDHPNIVPIYEVGEHDDRPFFSMKLIEGASLSRQVGAVPRTIPGRSARLVSILARAVHYAHGKGFLHCDLKPSNVLLDAHGQPVSDRLRPGATDRRGQLAVDHRHDPGHAQLHGPRTGHRHRGRGSDPATDVYGLGAILYELLTGRPPFRIADRDGDGGPGPRARPRPAARAAAGDPPRAGEHLPQVPGEGARRTDTRPRRPWPTSWTITCKGDGIEADRPPLATPPMEPPRARAGLAPGRARPDGRDHPDQLSTSRRTRLATPLDDPGGPRRSGRCSRWCSRCSSARDSDRIGSVCSGRRRTSSA